MEIAVAIVGSLIVITIIKLSLSEKKIEKESSDRDCFSIKNIKYTIMDREL